MTQTPPCCVTSPEQQGSQQRWPAPNKRACQPFPLSRCLSGWQDSRIFTSSLENQPGTTQPPVILWAPAETNRSQTKHLSLSSCFQRHKVAHTHTIQQWLMTCADHIWNILDSACQTQLYIHKYLISPRPYSDRLHFTTRVRFCRLNKFLRTVLICA